MKINSPHFSPAHHRQGTNSEQCIARLNALPHRNATSAAREREYYIIVCIHQRGCILHIRRRKAANSR